MAENKEYSKQNEFAFQQAYVDSVPRLSVYLRDQGTSTKWADLLYAACELPYNNILIIFV